MGHSLGRSRNLALFEGLDDVAIFQVLVVGETNAALKARLHLSRVILEAAQRSDRALPDNGALAQESNLRTTGDDAVADEASGDGADLGNAKHFAHLGFAGDDLFVDRRQQSQHGRLDLLDQLVDDLVGPHLDTLSLSQFATALVRSDIEADDGRVRGLGELDVVLGDPADATVHDDELHVVALELSQRFGAGFERTLHVGLQDDVERRGLAALDLFEEVLESRTARRGHGLVANEARALGARFGERASVREVVRDAHLVTGERRLAESEDLHGCRGSGGLDLLALIVDERLDLAVRGAGDHRVTNREEALLDHDRGDRTASDFEIRLEHGADRSPRRSSDELTDLGDQEDLFEQFVDAGALQGRDLDDDRVAAPLLRYESVFADLLEDPIGVGVGLVHLVDRDDQGDVGGLGVVDRFDGLGHDADVGGDHQNDDVGDQ